jgi:NitT/TauT family transport system substrate-binding protein
VATLRSIDLSGAEHAAEKAFTFAKATTAETKAAAFATKRVTINFDVGSAALTQTTEYIIDNEVAKTLLAFATVRVRVEGNTDNTGERGANVALSRRRAQAVVDYLVRTYSFDANRFIVVGNGPDKPVAGNETADGRSRNRRTDIELLESR